MSPDPSRSSSRKEVERDRKDALDLLRHAYLLIRSSDDPALSKLSQQIRVRFPELRGLLGIESRGRPTEKQGKKKRRRFDPVIDVPFGYCHCGCGEKAPIVQKSLASRGYVKGQPHQYIHNHHLRSKPFDVYVKKMQNGCWEFQGARGREGHGMYSLNGITTMAHRFSWERTNGPIPEGMIVRHLVCDNPPCVNPAHLAVGTPADNTEDAIRNGRQFLGRPLAVREAIYEAWKSGLSYEEIVREFYISYGTVSNIIRKRKVLDAA